MVARAAGNPPCNFPRGEPLNPFRILSPAHLSACASSRARNIPPSTAPLTGCGCWQDVLPNDSEQYALVGRRSAGTVCFVELCLRTEEIPPAPVVTGGMVRRILGKRGRRWAAAVKFLATAVFPRRPSSLFGSHRKARTIPPKPLGEAKPLSRQCAHQRGGISILSLVFPTSCRRDMLPNDGVRNLS